MLQKLPGPGPGRQCRLRRAVSAPLCRPAHRPGAPFPAEDSLAVVRRRLEGICSAAGVDFQSLPVEVITAPTLRLDAPNGPRAPHQHRPSTPTASAHSRSSDPPASGRRERRLTDCRTALLPARTPTNHSTVAVFLVHHARKDAHSTRPGQALRGSSELHGWGDSNLYMRRRGAQLTLSTEHRAAPPKTIFQSN